MNQFVTLPNSMAENSAIKLDHVLVYLMCKKHMNNKTRDAFPSITTLYKLCRMQRNKVMLCLETLEKEGYIKITRAERRGQSNHYYFPVEKEEDFQMVAFGLLNNPDLTTAEKGYFAILQQYYFIDKDTATGKYRLSTRQISEITGLTASTLSRMERQLVDKGMLNRFKTNVKDQIDGLYKDERLSQLEKTRQSETLLAEDLNATKYVMIGMFQEMMTQMSKMNSRIEQLEQNKRPEPRTEFGFDE